MLTLFFTIIFIAELIIAIQIIVLVRKANKIVLDTNEKITQFRPEMSKQIESLKTSIKTVTDALNEFACFVSEKKDELGIALKKNILSTVLLVTLKSTGKKILTIVDTFSLLKKVFKF